jgi:hypothetical protein
LLETQRGAPRKYLVPTLCVGTSLVPLCGVPAAEPESYSRAVPELVESGPLAIFAHGSGERTSDYRRSAVESSNQILDADSELR